MTLGDWLENNPRARPLMMLGVVGVVILMVGVLLGIGKKKKDPLVSEVVPVATIERPEPARTTVPVGGPVQEHIGQPAQHARMAWITENDVPGRATAGLDVPAVRKFAQWEEVTHVREQDNWDLVRGRDAQELWVPSRYLRFIKPSNTEKPSPAEITVMDFYQAVARQDYGAAYNFLTASWKHELTFNSFVDGYARTKNLRIEIARVVPLGGERYQVDVTMTAQEGEQEVPYNGSYTVEKADGQWEMTSGTLTRAPRPERDLQGEGSAPPVPVPSSAPQLTLPEAGSTPAPYPGLERRPAAPAETRQQPDSSVIPPSSPPTPVPSATVSF